MSTRSRLRGIPRLVGAAARPQSIAAAALCWWSLNAWACPLCKEGLFAPGESAARSGAAQGYAWSIALLLGTPLAILIGVGVLIARASRRRPMQAADSGTKLPAT